MAPRMYGSGGLVPSEQPLPPNRLDQSLPQRCGQYDDALHLQRSEFGNTIFSKNGVIIRAKLVLCTVCPSGCCNYDGPGAYWVLICLGNWAPPEGLSFRLSCRVDSSPQCLSQSAPVKCPRRLARLQDNIIGYVMAAGSLPNTFFFFFNFSPLSSSSQPACLLGKTGPGHLFSRRKAPRS